jgi:hypothetical protein
MDTKSLLRLFPATLGPTVGTTVLAKDFGVTGPTIVAWSQCGILPQLPDPAPELAGGT